MCSTAKIPIAVFCKSFFLLHDTIKEILDYYFPIDNKLANNPALKGDETQQLLEDILNHLNLLYTSVIPLLNQITVFPGLPTVPSPTNIGLLSPLISDLETLRGKIKNIKSNNVYLK